MLPTQTTCSETLRQRYLVSKRITLAVTFGTHHVIDGVTVLTT